MQESVLTVTNKSGLHARPAALLVKAASDFQSQVNILKDGKTFNAKSILSVMSAGVRQGETVTIQTSGTDEEAALNAIIVLIQSNFGEG